MTCAITFLSILYEKYVNKKIKVIGNRHPASTTNISLQNIPLSTIGLLTEDLDDVTLPHQLTAVSSASNKKIKTSELLKPAAKQTLIIISTSVILAKPNSTFDPIQSQLVASALIDENNTSGASAVVETEVNTLGDSSKEDDTEKDQSVVSHQPSSTPTKDEKNTETMMATTISRPPAVLNHHYPESTLNFIQEDTLTHSTEENRVPAAIDSASKPPQPNGKETTNSVDDYPHYYEKDYIQLQILLLLINRIWQISVSLS